jgi:branched-chain amino acid transport system permease protein
MTRAASFKYASLVCAVGLGVAPFLLNSFSIWQLSVRICYYLLLVLSWNLISGYAGLFSFGHVAFGALGAYSSAIMVGRGHIPVGLSLLLGAAVAGVVGVFVGFLSVRIRGPYLVVVSFAFLGVTEIVIHAQRSLTGGASGLLVAPLFTTNSMQYSYLLGLALVIAYLVVQHLILRSHWRHYLFALRDNEFGASALGGNPRLWKIATFAFSASVAGLAGAFFGQFVGFILPSIGGVTEMSLVVVMGMVGGVGSAYGPVASTILMLIIDSQLRAVASGASSMMFGLVLVVVVLAFPAGLGGLGERLAGIGQRMPRFPLLSRRRPLTSTTDEVT